MLSSAAKPDGLDKAFASAKKALSLTGIDMAVKKPDEAKVSAKMTKAGKPAEFMLSCSGETVMLSIECAGAVVAELGELSIDIAKDRKKGLAILDALVTAKLMSKAQAEKLKAGARTGPDPKVVANELRKIADLKKKMAADGKITTYEDAKRDKVFFAGLTDYCVSEFSQEGLEFLAAVEKKTNRDKIIQQFIGKKAKTQVNISDASEKNILAGGDFDAAVDEVKRLIKSDTMKRYQDMLKKQYEKQISAAEAELKALG